MKKAISVLLAVAISLSQLALCAFAASDNPLQATDRITTQLAATTERKQEIEAARIQRENMKDAAFTYGISASATNNLGFILNRKTMTKREYEAFKWSFIISQFAVPLEDSLVDVFSQQYFNSMIEQNMDIAAVENFLTYGGTNPEEVKIMSSMLQDANFTDIAETTKSNYTLLYLYRADDTALHFSDLLYGVPDVNERFYVYDTILSSLDPDPINSLYYYQEELAVADPKLGYYSYNISEPTKIPVAVYDAQFYLYLQLAVGTYCLRNNVSITELEALYGTAQIVIDSYGNICLYTSSGAKILMPNFGNSILTAALLDWNGQKTETNQFCFYNKWITTLYSRTQRTHVGATVSSSDIFGSFMPIALGGSSNVQLDDESLTFDAESQGILGQYINELPYKNNSDNLSGTILLVDPADIVVTEYNMYPYFDSVYGSKEGSLSPVEGDPECYIMESISNQERDDLYTTIAVNMHNCFFYGPIIDSYRAENPFGWEASEEQYKELDTFRYGTYQGTIYSNIKPLGTSSGFFTHALSADFNEAFRNPYPIINTGINLASLDTTSNSGKTHYYKAAMSLQLGSWRFATDIDGEVDSTLVYSSNESHNASRMLLEGMNECLVLATTFGADQMVQDVRFSSTRAAAQDDGRDYTEIYLPYSVINLGQYCEAFFGEEKGMFVTKHQNYFSSDMEAFRELISTYLASVLKTTGNDGGDAYKQAVQWSLDKENDNRFLVLQSAYEKTNPAYNKGIFGFGARNESYNTKGIPVALSIANKYDDTAFIEIWGTSAIGYYAKESDKDPTYVYDFEDLADYLDDLYDYRGYAVDSIADNKEFWISTDLCTKTLIGYDSEGKEEYCNHVDQKDMRAILGCISVQIVKNTDKWTLTFYKYITENNKVVQKEQGKVVISEETVTDYEDNEITYWKASVNGTDITDDSPDILVDSGLHESDVRNITTMLNFMSMCAKVGNRLLSERDRSIAEFSANLLGICKEYGFDSEEFLYAMSMLQHGTIEDSSSNLYSDIYFFDEYQYLLRNTTELSGTPGSQNSMEFSAITYYWDRAYLPSLLLNQHITNYVFNNFGAKDVETPDGTYSAYYAWLKYEELLADHNKDRLDYSFSEFLDDYCFDTAYPTIIAPPFAHELTLQTQSLSEFIEKNSDIQHYFDFNTQVYNYLEPDTIILYPCIDTRPTTKPTIALVSGLADTVALWGKGSRIEYSDPEGNISYRNEALTGFYIRDYDFSILLLALQCNTDYEHNYLAVSPVKEVETTHVTKEELMDKANQFFENPVSSLEYILSGFLYKMHSTIATGSLGSVFSANWLLESDIYKWVIDRYVAIVTIAIVVLLFLKLTQFAMSKTRDYGSIGRAVVGILAMCMVPLVVFNGFIWAFDTTSSWALAGPTNKMLLGEVNYTVLGRVNSDPGVTAEYNAFREQFDKIQGEYDGITFEEMTDYGLDDPTYHQVPLSSYLRYLEFGTNYTNWYSSGGFVPIHAEHYDESMFYYFYDYIRAEFFNYIKSSDNASGSVTFIDVLDSERANLAKTKHSDEWKAAVTAISSAEGGIAQQTGEFLAMLNDTNYVYGLSINPSLADRYGGAYAKDLAGVYGLFAEAINKDGTITEDTLDFTRIIKNSAWRTAMNDATVMKVTDDINPDLWTDRGTIDSFCEDASIEGNYRNHFIIDDSPFFTMVVTSKLDLFNKSFNGSSEKVDLRENELVLTPLEEKLCQVTTNIYEKTLKALEYHSAEIKNESAIVLMALIATFEVSEAFDLEPTGPIPQTVTLDTVIRTAFIRDLDTLSSNSNTMYSIIAQGDSFGKVFIIFVLELTIAIAGILRIFIILYLTVGSFVVLALRLLHKAPATTDLVYGIVGNILALLALHALTLFLVVCAVEWVANATNAIPSLVLDIAVVVFIILMCCMLYKLVANLVKDAINMGGARIKAGVHQVVSGITNFLTHNAAIQSLATELAAGDVNVNANNVEGVSEEIAARELQHDKRARAEGILSNMSEVEDELEEASGLAETTAESDPTTNRVSRNVSQEREISENAQSDLQEASSLADSAQN